MVNIKDIIVGCPRKGNVFRIDLPCADNAGRRNAPALIGAPVIKLAVCELRTAHIRAVLPILRPAVHRDKGGKSEIAASGPPAAKREISATYRQFFSKIVPTVFPEASRNLI